MWYFNARLLTIIFLFSVWLHASGNNNIAKEHLNQSTNYSFLANKGQVTQTKSLAGSFCNC
ncbi:MAG: hypothetical protein BRD49_04180 [Bacteroidetes bacterium SW_10_40_5]|nr:MAG: hypothetical protein BRD49_04180 [Bacteroidetes bacterium SW_10_40_5]